MKFSLKNLVVWIAVAFMAYAIIKSPTKAGDVASDIIAFGGRAVKSLFVFFDGLLT